MCIAHHWSKYEGVNDIWIVSNCDSVELFINNKSIGMHIGNEYTHLAHPLFVWRKVRFTTGELMAVGYFKGSAAATFIRKTPGKPVALEITPDDTVIYNGGDMTRVLVTAIDQNRQAVRVNDKSVTVSVKGAADFLGENPVSLENGVTAFYIKTRSIDTGQVVCNVQCVDMTGATTLISVKSDTEKAGVK